MIQLISTEIELMKKLNSKYIVKLIEVLYTRNNIYMIQEFCEGGDLRNYLKKTKTYINEKSALLILKDLMNGLKILYENGIVHRDLKPENILLDKNGHIKLADFGLSGIDIKYYQQDIINENKIDEFCKNSNILNNEDQHISDYQLSGNSQIKNSLLRNVKNNRVIQGTPDYISPEILEGKENFHPFACDWWSIGVILFELIVGVPPFNDETIEKIFDNIKNFRIPWDQLEIGKLYIFLVVK